jgi:hypothetical protein
MLRRAARGGTTVTCDDCLAGRRRERGVTAVAQPAGAPPAGMVTASYRPDDVRLLFTDLTGVAEPIPMDAVVELARSTAGMGHRTVVPVEDAPSAETAAIFTDLLDTGARQVALLSCVLACRIAAIHPDGVVIASIARAGTPIGVVLHRLLRVRYRRASTHYSISILPALGIDVVALRYILDRHPAGAVRFVDGWSGKGGIARVLVDQLAIARAALGVDLAPELALLADPGGATALSATRDDVLLPSAVLNAPVSGVFSRSFRPALLGPDDFHAAVRYPDLAAHDVSRRFVDTVCAAAEEIDEAEVTAAVSSAEAAGPPTFHGWAFVETLAAQFQAPNMLSFVKPGLNEACRALVARRPALVLIDPAQASPALDVICRLAAERDVPVIERPMPYAAVGIAEG